ncbi:uncharacterized protein B0P05DRAFT_526748 [Gilbertella persicaria]|nr:uncharacterized protein B0P05DRAFT_526748 [Gilbertella persicaria]KAI8091251.1 hypothetical protein B0P05DRAFT_526748 [Gilbertella persicaria]
MGFFTPNRFGSVRADCTSNHHDINKLLIYLDQDKSFQRETIVQETKVATKFRSKKPLQIHDTLTREFIQQNTTAPHAHWATEFNHPLARHWTSEFLQSSEKEQWAFERAFRTMDHASASYATDWDIAFRALESNAMDTRWQQEFDAQVSAPVVYQHHPDLHHSLSTRPHAMTTYPHSISLDTKKHEEARKWEALGRQQQEDEQDQAAITTLEKAVSIDPYHCLSAWLALSISYTNEHRCLETYRCLEAWMAHHPRYKHMIQAKDMNEKALHAYITRLFLEAARISPGSDMDPDVQIGLGVLFHIAQEYDKAIDCFQSALVLRPFDHALWNTLGATLANGRDYKPAIEMYQRALDINPHYIRARYNLATSYMHHGQYDLAAHHYLMALETQHNNHEKSHSIWDSLRLLMYM